MQNLNNYSTVTVTDQSLSDLSDSNVTKTQLLEFSFRFLFRENQHIYPGHLISTDFGISPTTKMKSDDGAVSQNHDCYSVMTQSKSVQVSIR